jgi:DNA-binding GntR family transcriptional regulator
MSKSNEVYDLIVDRLVNAHYAFGARLLVKELSAETGASRQPIMSALNRLSAEGFVRIVPQVGCEVIDPSRDEIADFFLLFQRTEGLLAELAAMRRTDDDIMQLKMAQQRLQALAEAKNPSPQDYAVLNRDFHHALHLMAHSPLLDRKQRNNFNMSDFFITHSVGFRALIPDAVREHDQIIDAVVRRQQDRARLEAESHIAAVASSVLSGLEGR